ncbi:SdpI family protein [Staphylococcus sp. 11261D007BR]
MMVLFPSSIFLFMLGNLFVHYPPEHINNYWGFRTKKSMKNNKNWKIAQKEFGIQSKQLYMYTSLFSLPLLLIDILLIIFYSDTILILSLVIQSVLLVLSLMLLYLNIHKKLC